MESEKEILFVVEIMIKDVLIYEDLFSTDNIFILLKI